MVRSLSFSTPAKEELDMIIAIHALQALGPNALNLDENGFPKTMVVGEARRGRISSQAQKRALRKWAEKQAPTSMGIRTVHLRNRLFLPRLRETTKIGQYHEQDLDTIADLIITAFAGELKAEGKLAASIFTWPGELDLLVQLSLKHVSGLLAGGDKSKQTAAKIVRSVLQAKLKKPFALAAFGRMISTLPAGNIDGAVAFSHAFTTHDVFLNIDNFVAIDDLAEDYEASSFLLKDQPFLAASTFYRHFSIDTVLLQDHLGSPKAAQEAIRLILEAFWHAVPSGGKQKTYKADDKPQFIVATLGGDGRSRGAAFMAPIRDKGDILLASIQRFDDVWRRSEMMRRRSEGEVVYTATEYPETLNYLQDTVVSGGYDELIDKIELHLEG
jgi:CRISPR system Cascade subunit CasC